MIMLLKQASQQLRIREQAAVASRAPTRYIQLRYFSKKGNAMKLRHSFVILAVLSAIALAQQAKPVGVVDKADLKTLMPSAYFYRGQSATVQIRNSAAIRTKDQKYILAGLVDTSGYASDVAQKYQGLFITEVKLKVEGSELAPGEYGMGFVGDKFVVTDVGANHVLSVSSKRDQNLKRPVPLQIVQEGEGYRLYAGRKYVSVQPE
jgi:hypothetical protein